MNHESERSKLSPESAEANVLVSFFSSMWNRKFLVLIIILIATTTTGAISMMLPEKFAATAVVAAANYDSGSTASLNGLVGQLGGVAALAGINPSLDTVKAEALATMKSITVTTQFIERNNLMPIIYSKYWDESRSEWNRSPEKRPTIWRATDFFRKHVRSVIENRGTGLVEVTVTWTDADLAADWANGLVELTNEILRRKAIQESERNIEYLKRQSETTGVIEVQRAISAVLESELRKVMLANGRDEYAFVTIDPAVPPEIPSSPRLVLWLATGFLTGVLVSSLIVLSVPSRP